MPHDAPPPLIVVSGGTGASCEQLVQALLVQFTDCRVEVEKATYVRHEEQVALAVARAEETGGTLVHTLVDARIRDALASMAEARGVAHVDLAGPLLARLTEVLGSEPVGRAGLYRHLHRAHYQRVEAIEFTVLVDDGLNPDLWGRADLVLAGLSRVGKTPLSMYLAVLGFKTANVPLVPRLPVPPALLELDRRRVIGLHLAPDHLLSHRRERAKGLGTGRPTGYADERAVHEEVEFARGLFRRNGISVIDMTKKPIETSAEEAIGLLTSRFADGARRSEPE